MVGGGWSGGLSGYRAVGRATALNDTPDAAGMGARPYTGGAVTYFTSRSTTLLLTLATPLWRKSRS